MRYGSVAETAMRPESGRVIISRLLAASVLLAAVCLLVGGGINAWERRDRELLQSQLYDIPNFVYQRTQTHFPEAEEGWLNQAAAGKIGDDVKPEKTLKKLNEIMSEARTHALAENYEARVKAKTLAMTENYDEYDVQKGRVIHKVYGKETGPTPTLKQKQQATLKAKQSAQALEADNLPQLAQPQVSGGMMMMHNDARDGIDALVKAEAGDATASAGQQQLASAGNMLDYEVQVPLGRAPGQMFLAKIPSRGNMLVEVPKGVAAGQWVAIKVPSDLQSTLKQVVKKHPMPAYHGMVRVGHPEADRMFAESIADHYKTASR